MEDYKQLAVKLAIDSWNIQISRLNQLLEKLTDEKLLEEVAPKRNRGSYLLGHLTAVHDHMLPLLDFGKPLYPQLHQPFIVSPDRAISEVPSVKELRAYWKEVNETLVGKFNSLTADAWFQRHTAVSEEDFKKEPNRNKLNLLLNRTNHLSYHYGQMAFLNDRAE